ncbi:MAG TPA: benzoate-CoA ligase family protein [Blastocatellia bacterium]|nr:benzoate-CoA ligase family protein [Blastocatellia bacterium]
MNLIETVFRKADQLDRWAAPAIRYRDGTVSYQQLLQSVKRCGGLLKRAGIEPGERVAILARDCPEFIVSFLGATAIRAVAVPINTMLRAADLAYILNDCGARAALITGEQGAKLSTIKDQVHSLTHLWVAGENPEGLADFNAELSTADEVEVAPAEDRDLALILYTSGSTGKPKGAMHRHGDLPYTVNSFCNHVLAPEPDDRFFSSSRLFFAYGLGNSLSFPLSSGASVILLSEKPSSQAIAETFHRYHPTIFFGVPAVFRALGEYVAAGNKLDTSSLRLCISAGEKLPESLFHEWKNLTGLDVLDGLGSTEMLHTFLANTRNRVTPGSSGRPVPGYEVKLLDPQGAEVIGPGSGELVVKGGSSSPGYWNDPERTARTIEGDWVRTGDVYSRDAGGEYWCGGRADDLFKIHGLWVQPAEVEEAILASEEIVEAAVVPGSDERGMTTVVAYLVPRSGCSPNAAFEQELTARIAAQLPAFKRPCELRFISQLPRTATGKVQRYKLRDQSGKSNRSGSGGTSA